MRKIIVFGSLITIFLMLMIPNISAIQCKTINEYNTEELKNNIIERIQQLKNQQKEITIIGFNFTNPDGPLEGGLDDFSDFAFLLYGIWVSPNFIKIISRLFEIQNLYDFMLWLFSSSMASVYTILSFAEAFDVLDIYPYDGN